MAYQEYRINKNDTTGSNERNSLIYLFKSESIRESIV